MTTVMLIPGAMSFGYTGTLRTYLGGPEALLRQLAAIEGQPPPSAPPTVQSIAYNDWDPIGGAYDGADQINFALQTHFRRSSADPVVVVAHSYGSVSSVLWLRNQGALSWIDP